MTFKEYVYSFTAALVVTVGVVYMVLCFMEYVARQVVAA